ncbi:MAG: GEVED domain-containing protein [Chitinophagales bacterium]
MKTNSTHILLVVILCLLSSNFLAAQSPNPSSDESYCKDKIFLKIKEEAGLRLPKYSVDQKVPNYPVFGNLIEEYKVKTIYRPFPELKSSAFVNTYQVNIDPDSDIDQLIATLQADPNVEYAEKVPVERLFFNPNDPAENAGEQWHLGVIDAFAAWDLSLGDESVVVAVVDDAVKITHEDLVNSVWVNAGEIAGNGIDDDNNGYVDDVNGWDVADNDNNPNPPSSATASSFSHGTHVAGLIGATTNNGKGVAAIGAGVSIMAVKCTENNTSNSSIISHGWSGFQYAMSNGADVINISWGGTGYSYTYQALINAAYNAGITIVAAAGNSSTSTQFYPAAYNNVIAVAATTSTDTKASFSNYGPWVDVAAPGSSLKSCIASSNTAYGYKSGTSMASPVTAGLCALLLSYEPTLQPADILSCLTSTAVPVIGSSDVGAGRISANAAMLCAAPASCSAPYNLTVNNLSSTNATLTWADTDAASYTVRIRQTGGNWTTFNTPNTSYSYSANSCESYEFEVKSNCSGESSNFSSIQTFTTLPDGPSNYCIAEGNTANFEWIAGVTFAAVNITSSSNGGYSQEALCYNLNVETNDDYTLILTPGFAGAAYGVYWRAWIDFNRDGDFSDANELVYDAGSSQSGSVTPNIAIPSSASTGSTRMRIAMKWTGASDTALPNHCGTFEFGEVEDYTLVVSQGAAPVVCNRPTTVNAANISESSATINWSNVSGSTGYNIRYRKQGSGWNYSVATSNFKSLTGLDAGSNYEVEVQSKCASNTTSDYSATKSFTTSIPVCSTPTDLIVSNIEAAKATISWSGSSQEDYQVHYRKTSSTVWSSLSVGSTNVSIPSLQSCTEYEVQIRTVCDLSESSFTMTKKFETIGCQAPEEENTGGLMPNGYCTSRGYNANYEWIAKVVFGSINNTSGSDGGYGDYTSKSTDVELGQSYNVTLQAGYAGSAYREYWKVWIDYNRDGDFGDDGELAFDAGGLNNTPVTAGIKVPTNASIGTTRVRISMKYNAAADMCESFTYGEVEDYAVNIISGGGQTEPTPSAGGGPAPDGYCDAQSQNSNYEWIEKVSIGSINNSSSNDNGYGNYTHLSTDVDAGSSQTIILQPGYVGAAYNESWQVWIDFNRDGDFSDIAELAFSSSSPSKNTVTAAITIPADASIGSTRMRITMKYNGTASDCGNYNYGEVEDYELNIRGAGGNNGGGNSDSNPMPDGYCDMQSQNASYEWIAKVELGDISNATASNNGYGDFTNLSTELIADQSYSLGLTPGFKGAAYNESWKVWIDYNRDGDFTDAGELVFEPASNKNKVVGSIKIPATAMNGVTLMRVAMKYNGGIPNSCGAYTYGEVEDYSVVLVNNLTSTVEMSSEGDNIQKADPTEPNCDIDVAFDYTVSGEKADFINYSMGKYDTFFWSFGDGEFSEETSPVHHYKESGEYFFNLSISSTQSGCSQHYQGFIYIFGEDAEEGNNNTVPSSENGG